LKNAEFWYRKAIEYQSKAWEVYNNLAEISIREHNYQSALELLEKSIQYNPQSPLPKLNKAFILASVNNQKQEALAIYDDILKTNPDNTNALLNAGYLSYQMKGYTNTKKYLERYVALAPRDPETPKIQKLLRSLE
jgi:regulator of sirC expression with transglutaminase-like and TPR domain